MLENLDPYNIDKDLVISLIKSGNRIEAVRIIHKNTDWGLKKSKDFIDLISENSLSANAHGIAPNNSVIISDYLPATTLYKIQQLIREQKFSEAIALLSHEKKLDLINAKQMVEAIKDGRYRFTLIKNNNANRLRIETRSEEGNTIVSIQKGDADEKIINPDDPDWALVQKSMIYNFELQEYEKEFLANKKQGTKSTLFIENHSVFALKNVVIAGIILVIILVAIYFNVVL